MSLQTLKENMKKSEGFKKYLLQEVNEQLNDVVVVTAYQNWLLLERDKARMGLSRENTRWLEAELRETVLCLTAMDVDKVMQVERRRSIARQLEEFKKEDIGGGDEADLIHYQAAKNKQEVKASVKGFLSAGASKPVTQFKQHWWTSSRDNTADALALLEKEKTQCDIRIRELEHQVRQIPGEPERNLLRAQIDSLYTRQEEADKFIEMLKTSKSSQKQAGVDRTQSALRAESTLKKISGEALEERVDTFMGAQKLKGELTELEAKIAQKMKEQKALIERLPGLHREKERLEAINRKLGNTATDAGERMVQAQIADAEQKHQRVSEELAFLNAKYEIVRSGSEKALLEEQRLLKRLDSAKREVERLKKLGQIDKALNIYVGAWSVTFELLLQIGKLAAGESCGIVGGGALAVLGAAAGFQKSPLAGVLSAAGTAALLKNIHAYDTGAFGVSFKLGLSWGIEQTLATQDQLDLSVGLALVYDGSITVEDDRRFRTISTLTLKLVGEASIPKAISLGIEAELLKDKTVMTFSDVYHWAAWLGQKWANAFAWVRAVSVYDSPDKYSQPTPEDLDRMKQQARLYFEDDERLRDLMKKVRRYMREPIVRSRLKEYKPSSIAVDASAAELFGLGFTLEKTAEPWYFKRSTDPDTKEVSEVAKRGKQFAAEGRLAIGVGLKVSYSNVEVHANPDNEGRYLTFTPSIPIFDQQVDWVAKSEKAVSAGKITNAIEDTLGKAAGQIQAVITPDCLQLFKNAFATSAVAQLFTSVALGTVEIALWCSKLETRGPKGEERSKWVLLYWRPIFNTKTVLNASIPLGYGFNADLGGSVSLSRTYLEHLGSNTLGTIRTVYHGYMNITPPTKKKEPRPEEARGDTLWNRWLEAHRYDVWDMLCGLAKPPDKAGKVPWIAEEAKELPGGPQVIERLRSIQRLREWGTFDDPAWKEGRKNFEIFLAAAREDYIEKRDKGWYSSLQMFEHGEGTDLYTEAVEHAEAKEAAEFIDPRLKPTVTVLGDRKGLPEQILQDVAWVPDEKAPNCQLCGTKFTTFTRRHHCRNCGGVFCAKCTPYSIPLPHRGFKEKEKVCKTCYDRLTKKGVPKAHSPEQPQVPQADWTTMKPPSSPAPQPPSREPAWMQSPTEAAPEPPVQKPAWMQMKPPSSPAPQPPAQQSLLGIRNQRSPLPMHADDIIQKPNTSYCYIDSTLYSVLARVRNGAEIVNRLIQSNPDGSWTVNFQDGSTARVEPGMAVKRGDLGPAWQQAFDIACARKLGKSEKEIGQLNDLPRLFGWRCQDLPDGPLIHQARENAIPIDNLYRLVYEGITAAFRQAGCCITYMSMKHAVCLTNLVPVRNDTELTFFNPLGETREYTASWQKDIKPKLMETVFGSAEGGEFCIFWPA